MIDRIRVLVASKTGRDVQLLFGGQFIGAVLGFAFNILLLRTLSVGEYGIYVLVSSALMFLAGFAHFGWIETLVRFGAQHVETSLYSAIRKSLLKKVLLSSALVCLVGAALGPWASAAIFRRVDITWYLYSAALGAFFTSIYSFISSDYRTRQKFKSLMGIQIGTTVLRVAVCLVLAWAGRLTLPLAIAVQVFAPLVSSLVALIDRDGILAKWRTPKPELPPDLYKEMGDYNYWIIVSMVTVNIIGNIDSQILAHYHDNTVLAGFGAASRLTLPIQFAVTALTTALLPKLSAKRSADSIRYYLSRLKYFLLPATFLLLLAIWIAPPILTWVAGEKYLNISTLLRLQIFTSLIMLLANPVGLVLSSWGWSKGFAILNLAQLIVDLILDLLWIPRFGAVGAVSATLVVNMMGMIYIYAAVMYGLRGSRNVSVS